MYLIIYVIIRQTYRCAVVDRNAKVRESHNDSHFCGISMNHLCFMLHVIYLFILLSVTTLNGFLGYFNMNFPFW